MNLLRVRALHSECKASNCTLAATGNRLGMPAIRGMCVHNCPPSWESLVLSVERHPTIGNACVEHCCRALTAMLVERETLRALRGLYSPCSQAKARPMRRRLPWPSPSKPRGGQGPCQTSGQGSGRSRGKRVPVPASPRTRKEHHNERENQANNVHEDQEAAPSINTSSPNTCP